MISHARLPINISIISWQEEVSRLTKNWTLHFNTMHFEGQWTVISLRSPGGKSNQIIPDIIGNEMYADTEIMASIPSIRKWLKELHCDLLSVRLLNLQRNSVIKEHRDHELAFENGEARLHIPIFTNPDVEFVVNNESVKMHEGECWYINANLPHRVANRGTTDRIHLVVDCKVNDWIEEWFQQGEVSKVPQSQLDEQTRKIISELRMQNTEFSNKLADQLENGGNA